MSGTPVGPNGTLAVLTPHLCFSTAMTVPGTDFTSADDGPFRTFERKMRDEGWAAHVTVTSELDTWTEVARSVTEYRHGIDDYTNDLYSRQYLERAIGDLPQPFAGALRGQVDEVDSQFRDATEPDDDGLLARYHRVDDSSGWWWRRIPEKGELADYLRYGG